MKKEIDYFYIGDSYGGCQDWFRDIMMKKGGCAAATACDSSIYFDMHNITKGLYPYDINSITKDDYIRFSTVMKPYLRPRWMGVDTLKLYIDGFTEYIKEVKPDCSLKMEPFDGNRDVDEAKKVISEQIDNGYPIPCLILQHKDKSLEDYIWHWFLITGYESLEDEFMVKTATYSEGNWVDFNNLWNTGYERKGGLVIYKPV